MATLDATTRELVFAATHDVNAARRFARLARRNGYVGKVGGWIWNTDESGRRTDRPICQGWQNLAHRVLDGTVPFGTVAK